MKTNRSSIHKFLEPLLEAGADKTALIEARHQYLKEYKAEWQRKFRNEHKQFTVSLNKKELQVIKKAASEHQQKPTKFLKSAALAYCKGQFLIPNPESVNRIRELLIMNYASLQQLTEENNLTDITNNVLTMFSELEKKILIILEHPNIIKKQISDDH